MAQCEYHPDKECRFLHLCQGVGCSHEGFEVRKYPTRRSPWQSGYKPEPPPMQSSDGGRALGGKETPSKPRRE
jgi:hypothetical protein